MPIAYAIRRYNGRSHALKYVRSQTHPFVWLNLVGAERAGNCELGFVASGLLPFRQSETCPVTHASTKATEPRSSLQRKM